MITVTNYKNYWDHVVTELTPDGLKKAYVVATEERLTKKINDLKGSESPFLVAIIPSSDPKSIDDDAVGEVNSGMIFILQKRAHADQDDATFLQDMDTTQAIMKKVKELMQHDKITCSSAYHSIMERLNLSSLHQDPEYNYLGCNGWSLSFQFETLGF